MFSMSLWAQIVEIKGQITSPDNQPVKDAIVIVSSAKESVKTDEKGMFSIEVAEIKGTISVIAAGYFEMVQPLRSSSNIEIVLIPSDKMKYGDELVLPYNVSTQKASGTTAQNIANKDFGTGISIESALQGEVAGLNVINKSGMPGEGAYMNIRGIKTFVGNSAPLIVIDGVPYIPDMEESSVIGGYSRGILSNYDIADIQNITILKGADASIYGSMGANGVIMIQTNEASEDDLETKLSYSGQFGISTQNNTIPVLGVDEYKSYLSDIGLTYYNDMEKMIRDYPFLTDDPDYYYNYLYNNDTDWQNEIYAPTFTTKNVFRVEGGDAIAKYDISLGYLNTGGIVDNTNQDNYHTQINSNILVSRNLSLTTTVGLSYLTGNFQEQGLINETNPVLLSYKKLPVLSPFEKDENGNTLEDYAVYTLGNGGDGLSNPLAIVNTLEATNKQYNVNIKLGANYKLSRNITLNGVVGLYYNYLEEQLFIPGLTEQTVVPLFYNLAKNTVREGVGENKDSFYKLSGYYSNVFDDIHKVNISGGLQVLSTSIEYDAGSGYNTASDFYKTLNYVSYGTEKISGYINDWNWANAYAHGDYTWNNLVKGSLNMSIDRASSTGNDATKFGFFPSAGLTLYAKNLKQLSNSTAINKFDIRTEYSSTGNSRFSSNYSKNYYISSPYQSLSGVVRASVPNTNLKWENTKQFDFGIDLTTLRHRLSLSMDYYLANTSDILLAQTISSVFGSANYYDNTGEIQNSGVELAINVAIVENKNFNWDIGGNISFMKSEVKSLGNMSEMITNLADGAQVITKVGENPYSFYGLKAEGVYETSAIAKSYGLSNWKDAAYGAGDVIFYDKNDDKTINNNDKELLGSATPDFFGGFYTQLKYQNIALTAEFSYSVGNEAYNATRRSIESMQDFSNQSKAALNRWQHDGQKTNTPKAVYGDPMQNNIFSSRWIEDASYLKLRSLTLSYSFNQSSQNIFHSGTFFVTGENLFTWTKYLGLDPEFAYSYNASKLGVDYAKVALPRTFKIGVNLKF